MNAPFCPVCRSEHWAREPHKWDKVEPVVECQRCVELGIANANLLARARLLESENATLRNHSTVQKAVVTTSDKPVTKPNVTNSVRCASVTKPKRDRAAYMREYRNK